MSTISVSPLLDTSPELPGNFDNSFIAVGEQNAGRESPYIEH
jgi:hypothetical protein